MSKEFMIARDGQQYGPYSTEDLLQYLKDGQVSLDDLVWSEGMEDWRPLREVRDQLASPSAAKSMTAHQNHVESESPAAIQRGEKKIIGKIGKYKSLLAIGIVIAVGFFVFVSREGNTRPSQSAQLTGDKYWLSLRDGVENVELTQDGRLAPAEVKRFCKSLVYMTMGYAKIKDTSGDYKNLQNNVDFILHQYPSEYQHFLFVQWEGATNYIDQDSGNLKNYYVPNGNRFPSGSVAVFSTCLKFVGSKFGYNM